MLHNAAMLLATANPTPLPFPLSAGISHIHTWVGAKICCMASTSMPAMSCNATILCCRITLRRAATLGVGAPFAAALMSEPRNPSQFSVVILIPFRAASEFRLASFPAAWGVASRSAYVAAALVS